MEEFLEGPIIHFLAMLLSLGVMYFVLKLKAGFSNKISKSLNYFVLAAIFLVMLHGLELLGHEGISLIMVEHEIIEGLEHLFFFVAMIFMMISLNKMAKAFGEEAKNKDKEEEE